jgi:hypothetical protein
MQIMSKKGLFFSLIKFSKFNFMIRQELIITCIVACALILQVDGEITKSSFKVTVL